MYTCLLRVRHLSLRGPPYERVHVVAVVGTMLDAVLDTGAVPPEGMEPILRRARGFSAEISYPNGALPTVRDPDHVIVHLTGLEGGVYVPMGYGCSYEHLTCTLIPAKLRAIGVHKHDAHGALMSDAGTPVLPRDMDPAPTMWWTKLGVRVAHEWPAAYVHGITMLQRRFRGVRAVKALQRRFRRIQKKDADGGWMLPQGVEPWTICS